MNILGLPGKNSATGPWMEEILSQIDLPEDTRNTQYYKAWQEAGSEIDEVVELDLAAGFDPNLIVAKSMGSILTLIGVGAGKLKPTACVLIGVPVNGLLETEKSVLQNWQDTGISLLCIQQTSDVTGTYEQLEDLAPEANGLVTLVEIAGSDHVYSDVPELTQIINKWHMSLGLGGREA